MTGPCRAGLAAAFRTDSGSVRSNNEDLPLCDPERGIFGVIDGVGGQAAGEVAAGIASTEILARLARPLGTPAERVREAIALANNEIFRQAQESSAHYGMTCVLTLALVVDRRITIGHVGDSRCYKLAPGGIRKLTHDHSPVGEREDAREITESEAMRHPRRNEVFRDVGSDYRDKDDEGFVEIVEDTLESDHAILLCSDGLSDMVSSSTIEYLVRRLPAIPIGRRCAVSAAKTRWKRQHHRVYAEAPGFARRRGRWTGSPSPEIRATPEWRASPVAHDRRISTRRHAGGFSRALRGALVDGAARYLVLLRHGHRGRGTPRYGDWTTAAAGRRTLPSAAAEFARLPTPWPRVRRRGAAEPGTSRNRSSCPTAWIRGPVAARRRRARRGATGDGGRWRRRRERRPHLRHPIESVCGADRYRAAHSGRAAN